MIKIRILTGMTAASAAALAIPSLAGCAAADDGAPQDDVGTGAENNTASIAGSGNIALHSYSLNYTSTSHGDEFIRVGEKMTVAVAFSDVLDKIAYQFDPAQAPLRAALTADPTKVKITLSVTYTKFDESKVPASLAMSWGPGAGGALVGTSPDFVIPGGVKLMSVEINAAYEKAGIPTTTDVIHGQGIPNDFVVFGAFLPNKLALFDNLGADRRTRVIEGGAIIKGSHATLAYTDWRLDTVTNKVGMDLRVGQRTSASRFGTSIVDALGSLEYEVTAAVSTDGGATYNPVTLSKVMRPSVFARTDGYRYAMQTELGIPANAGPSLKVAFHVKAFLQVPNYAPGEIFNARYAPGQRVLLTDMWDNNNGQNYALPIADHD
jgi:hypothetical protein